MDPSIPSFNQVESVSPAGQVITIDPPDKSKVKEFAFTLWDEEMPGVRLMEILGLPCKKFAFQREVCPSTGKVHFQGQMSLHDRQSEEEVWKWFPGPSQVRKTRNVIASEVYCQKGRTRVEGPWTKGDVAKVEKGGRPRKGDEKSAKGQKFVTKFEIALRPVPETWRAWQLECMRIARGRPDERTVYWFWGPDGNSGKTTMSHMLCAEFEGQVIGGQLQNVLACATEAPRRLYIVAAARKTKPEKFPYEAIEMLKDGIWLKGKNEVVPVVRKSMVHVFVFANCAPVLENFTMDRWKVMKIDGLGDKAP